MIHCLADNIHSPFGNTTADNFAALRRGAQRPTLHRLPGVPEPLCAALWPEGAIEARYAALYGDPEGLSRFEQLALLSIRAALAQTELDVSAPDCLLLLSTTKANVRWLAAAPQSFAPRTGTLGETAAVIARHAGFSTVPVVVSNACISGAHALLLAARLLRQKAYRHVVVCGVDEQSPFIAAGFQSFRALSLAPCRPFDAARDGLNLGEAAATLVLSSDPPRRAVETPRAVLDWCLVSGAVRNDANHISGPSRTGEGAFRALRATLPPDVSRLAFVSAHGTATPYNDEMESRAFSRAALSALPVAAYKGLFGHTMGAAGVLETLLSFRAVEAGCVPPVQGFAQLGVTCPVSVSAVERPTHRRELVKMLSGFGGCNAALHFAPAPDVADAPRGFVERDWTPVAEVRLTSATCSVDGETLPLSATGEALLAAIYAEFIGGYPKFHKMDPLSRLGFVASELLLAAVRRKGHHLDENTAVVLVGHSGSQAADTRFQRTIAAPDNYYPSPAVFVYTLPNIATGEIAIRNGFHGETAYFALPAFEADRVRRLVCTAGTDPETTALVGGWIECPTADHFEAHLHCYLPQAAALRP